MSRPRPPLVVALSGLSSTGKSSVAAVLPSVFRTLPLSVLHVDDFYRPEAELPRRGGLVNWDCAASLDWPRLENAVRDWRDGKGREAHEGAGADGHRDNDKPEGGLQDLARRLSSRVSSSLTATHHGPGPGPGQRILLLDGFLLFTPATPPSFRSLLDVKIVLRAPYAVAKERREARAGYVTLEGWWEDPPGYFDKVVWPNYAEAYQGFFLNGDVEGEVDEEVCGREKVKIYSAGREGLESILEWVVDTIVEELRVQKDR
ncbi:MAG: hypothetical protein LQ342_003211 [Letrouitia transgressa]|nr:MAG: hypothetical protein LQ342_003211 [Letrouitia transgressa]